MTVDFLFDIFVNFFPSWENTDPFLIVSMLIPGTCIYGYLIWINLDREELPPPKPCLEPVP